MRVLLTLVLVSICMSSGGSAPPTPVTLTKKLATDLGFQIKIEPDGPLLMVTMRFPQRIDKIWKAYSAGFALLDSNGDEITINAMHYSPESTEPVIVAAFDPVYGTGSIWVAYSCDSEEDSDCYGKYPVQYQLNSVSEYASSL